MEKTEYKWVKLLGFKAGLRYFRDTLTDQVAVADNSGKYPDTTEDGVLWLNLDVAVAIELGSREYSRVTVPVKSVRGQGRGYYVGEEITHLAQFLPLWTSLGGKVELRGDVNADVLQLLLEHVTRPLQRKCTVCDHFLPPGMVSGIHLVKIAGKEIPCAGPEEAATGKDEPAGDPCQACGRPTQRDSYGRCSACGGFPSERAQARITAGPASEPTLLPLPLDVRDIALLRAALVAYERVVERARGMTDGDRKQELVPVEDLRRRLARAQEGVDAAIMATVVGEGK